MISTSVISLIAFVSIAIAVLQVILFFKIWGACNDIRRLSDHFIAQETIEASISNRIAAGDDSVESSVRRQLANDIERLCKKCEGITEEDFIRIEGYSPAEAISALKDKYAQLFGRMNRPLPPELAKLETIEDLWEWNSR